MAMQERTCFTAEEARAYAMDWQTWMSNKNLSYGEIAEWQAIFRELAERFDLTEEFEENCII
jgi:hypothetical protein